MTQQTTTPFFICSGRITAGRLEHKADEQKSSRNNFVHKNEMCIFLTKWTFWDESIVRRQAESPRKDRFKMRLFILFMIPFIGHLVVGCTSSHDVLVGSADETRASSTPISGDDTSTVEQFNERLREEIPTVTLRSGSEWTAVNVKLIRDSLSWTTPDFMATSRVHYAMIDRIVTIHRWHGAAEGLLRGLMAGAGAAAVIQGVTGKEDRGNLKGAIILSSGVLGGSLLGAIVGFIRGHREEYTFKRQTR